MAYMTVNANSDIYFEKGCTVGKADNFAGRLRELRMAKGMSQAELARVSGIGQGRISHLEDGQAPTWPTLVALAEALGCTCQDFLAEPGEVEQPKKGRPFKQSGANADAPLVSDGAKPQPPAIETERKERADGKKKGKGRKAK